MEQTKRRWWPYVLAAVAYTSIGVLAIMTVQDQGSWSDLDTVNQLMVLLGILFSGTVLFSFLYLIGAIMSSIRSGELSLGTGERPHQSDPSQWTPSSAGSSTQPLSDEEMERRRAKARRRAVIMATYMYEQNKHK